MRRALTSIRLAGGSAAVTLIALGFGLTALGNERSQLRMPQIYDEFSGTESIEQTPINTDPGVMGEIELVRERYSDGEVKIERQVTLDQVGNYVNHGSWKMFSPEGDVVAEGQFHFGKRVGLWTRWHGRKESPVFDENPYKLFKAPFMSQVNFTDGAMDGEWIIVDASDKKCNQISLKMGQRHGLAITWLPNGKTFRQESYDNGKLSGDRLEINKKSDEVARVATFVDGRKIASKANTFYPGTKQKKTETMYLGATTVEQSPDEFWNVRFAKYATEGKDLRHGLARTWYSNGMLEQEGTYQYGKKSGTFTFWHENGQVAANGEYKDDQPTGTWVWWHENGLKSAYGRYENGVLIGEWRWWNESGKLTKQHVYDGKESVTTQSESSRKVSRSTQETEGVMRSRIVRRTDARRRPTREPDQAIME